MMNEIITTESVKLKSLDELNILKINLQLEMFNIDCQLENSDIDCKYLPEDEIKEEGDWRLRAKRARKFKGIQHQMVLNELNLRNNKSKQKRHSEFEKVFVDQANILLDKETFCLLIERTTELLEGKS